MIVLEPRLSPVLVLFGALLVAGLLIWWIPRAHRLWASVLLVTGLPALSLVWLGITPQVIRLEPEGMVVVNHLGTPVARYGKGELARVSNEWRKYRGQVLVLESRLGPPQVELNVPKDRLTEVGEALAGHMGLRQEGQFLWVRME